MQPTVAKTLQTTHTHTHTGMDQAKRNKHAKTIRTAERTHGCLSAGRAQHRSAQTGRDLKTNWTSAQARTTTPIKRAKQPGQFSVHRAVVWRAVEEHLKVVADGCAFSLVLARQPRIANAGRREGAKYEYFAAWREAINNNQQPTRV